MLCAQKQARDGGGLVSVVVYSVSVVMQKEAVYGLTEIYREEVRGAQLVANPGCYPTSVQLPLIPLLQVGLCQRIVYQYLSAFCQQGMCNSMAHTSGQ